MSLDTAKPKEWDQAFQKSLPQSTALDKQVGGSHYKNFKIQPIEFIYANNIPFIEANVIKYICRYAAKGGEQDLDKVIHYAELLKELQYGDNNG